MRNILKLYILKIVQAQNFLPISAQIGGNAEEMLSLITQLYMSEIIICHVVPLIQLDILIYNLIYLKDMNIFTIFGNWTCEIF